MAMPIPTSDLHPSVAALAARIPPRAGGFIVSLYGDAIVPRGGAAWVGSVIGICALAGISETLVRTVLSRLVAAGTMQADRVGRRGFYRLTDRGRAQFDTAGQRIYGPTPRWRWAFVSLPDDSAQADLERRGFARLRAGLFVGPGAAPVPPGALVFDASPVQGLADLPRFAAEAWDLSLWAERHAGFVTVFAPLAPVAATLDPPSALAARVMLIDAWRYLRLREPGLPAPALPPDWPGHAAQRLFLTLYADLSPGAESHLDAALVGPQGPLPRGHAIPESRRALMVQALQALDSAGSGPSTPAA